MSGDFTIPNVPSGGQWQFIHVHKLKLTLDIDYSLGTPYVWPGLQSGNGVLQAVADGRTGTWWIGKSEFMLNTSTGSFSKRTSSQAMAFTVHLRCLGEEDSTCIREMWCISHSSL